jgi:hypothetical protein
MLGGQTRTDRKGEVMKSMRKKANEPIVAYESERKKRSRFQYEMGVKQGDGTLSLPLREQENSCSR